MITTVTGLKDAWFQGAAYAAIRHAQRRRGGKTSILNIEIIDVPSRVGEADVEKKALKKRAMISAKATLVKRTESSQEADEIEGEDGFISF
jgi:hypothetical protein